MSERLLKILIYASGVVCLYAFFAIRHPVLFNAVLLEKIIPEYWENTRYGELYYFNFVRHFRHEPLPPSSVKYRFTEKHPDLDEADMLLFGDSFFDFARLETFPEALGDSLGEKTFFARMDRPLQYLAEQGYETDEEKVIIFESAERYIPTRFTVPHRADLIIDQRSPVRQEAAEIRDYLFEPNTALLYHTLLKRSYLTTGLFSLFATLKFDVFGYISEFTPVYTLEEEVPWLFYYDQLNEEPGSFYYQYTQEEIDTYCDNIADLADKLNEHYNLKMVFMGIPSKYTVNHTLINDDPYNNFLPRIQAGLEQRGVPYIPLFEEYIESQEVLYFGTDTHWNERGQQIALEKTLRTLDTLDTKYFAP